MTGVFYGNRFKHGGISWFDVRDPASVPTEFNDDINQFADAFGDQLGVMVFAVTGTVSCLVASFVIGWQIAAVICSTSPAIAVEIIFMMQASDTMMSETQAFHKERFVLEQYEGAVEAARKGGVKHGLELGVSTGWMLGVILWTYGLAFWFCAKLRFDGVINPLTCEPWEAGDILSTFFAVLTGSCFVGQISPGITRYAGAWNNVTRFSAVLRREGAIQGSLKEAGHEALDCIMSLEVKDVHFSYPARPHIKVLTGLRMKFEMGSKVAFVGETGSGKSTVVSLLELFYDPDQGQVLVSGIDMTVVPVQYLRQRKGHEGREPVLFATSLRHNILQGRPDVREEALNKALGLAQLSFVVQELSDMLETFAGHGGLRCCSSTRPRAPWTTPPRS